MGDDIGTPKMLASEDGKSLGRNKHQQIEIKGKLPNLFAMGNAIRPAWMWN
jgi:hypothetical protein